ncbi:dynactin p62 family-domain-containing protein [Zopfochytrium polystomum]|nr:dynactin p62 family-domain-containing protein [Zopfochytrium polystomum]
MKVQEVLAKALSPQSSRASLALQPAPSQVAIPTPYVFYQCHCRNSSGRGLGLSPIAVSDGADQDPPTEADYYLLHPIQRLYFCDHCNNLKCMHCVQEEIVCYYCPNCLFEVPSASVKAEKNRCARNCFECPICCNTLSVVSVVDQVTTPATSGVHYLSCGVCRWSSLEIDLKFDRPTGLAMQLQKSEDDRDDVREFDKLRDYYERMARAHYPMSSVGSLLRSTGSINLPSSLLSGLSSLSSMSSRSASLHGINSKSQTLPDYEPEILPKESTLDDIEQFKYLMIDDATSLKQRINQVDDQPKFRHDLRPQRVQLRTKRSKRCRRCEHILVKPEQKAQIPKFKIQLSAIKCIPTITIAQPLPGSLLTDHPFELHLRFSNPLDQEISIEISRAQYSPEKPCLENVDVVIPASSFTVPPFNEFSEDDVVSEKSLPPGIIDRNKNFTVVSLNVTPKKRHSASSRVEIPLLVSFQRKLSSTSSNAEEVCVSYWVQVGLGDLRDG